MTEGCSRNSREYFFIENFYRKYLEGIQIEAVLYMHVVIAVLARQFGRVITEICGERMLFCCAVHAGQMIRLRDRRGAQKAVKR